MVDLNNPPGTTLAQACVRYNDPVVSDCVADCAGAQPGQGSSCGSAEYCRSKVNNDGWEMVGSNCCNSPLTAECWQKCKSGEYKPQPSIAVRQAIDDAWIAHCRAGGNEISGFPVDTPRGTFTDPRTWTNEFGYSYISELTKNYSGGEFPWANRLVCYR